MQATAARTGSRFRARSRLETPTGPQAHQGDLLQVGSLAVESVDVNPNPVQSGSQVTVVVGVRETIEFVGPGDPDLCSPTPIAGTGQLGRVTVDPDWTQAQSKERCVTVTSVLGPGRVEIQFAFTTPIVEAGVEDHSLEISLELPGSGQGPQSFTTTVRVSGEGGQIGCNTDGDCPAGQVCSAGECVPDGGQNGTNGPGNIIGDLFGDVQTGALVIVILFIVANALAPA